MVKHRLVYPDGRLAAARVGLVDSNGLMVNLVDEGKTQYFEYHPMSWIAQDMESEIEHLKMERDEAMDAIRELIDLYERSVDLNEFMLACGSFPKGSKTDLKDRTWKLRKDLKGMMSRWLTSA